ncbi:MAG: hypothetical protein HHJ11_00465 [Phycicoccus sp.]|nr:hypothetical protein [Phycicoccus sp.]NMM34718.1 hypothetical protein [Phycicoccus sp.]
MAMSQSGHGQQRAAAARPTLASQGHKARQHDPRAARQPWWERVPTVTLPTAIDQCIRSGVLTYLLRQSIATAAGHSPHLPTSSHPDGHEPDPPRET